MNSVSTAELLMMIIIMNISSWYSTACEGSVLNYFMHLLDDIQTSYLKQVSGHPWMPLNC